jgi:hypothetical protein
MKEFFNKLTSELKSSKENEFVCKDSQINWIFQNIWNINIILQKSDVELIKFGRHLSLSYEGQRFILKEYGKELTKTEKIEFIEQQKINVSFSFSEGIIRLTGTGLTDGTWKGVAPRTKAIPFISISNDKTKTYIESIEEGGKFFQISDSLKNIAGLKLWLKWDNPCDLYPETNKIASWKDNSGNSNHLLQEDILKAPQLDLDREMIEFNSGDILYSKPFNIDLQRDLNLTIMAVFEMSEFVFKGDKQRVLTLIDSNNNSIDMILEKEKDQIGRYPEYTNVTRVFCKHVFNICGKTFENKNFIDLFTGYKFLDRFIDNEVPGPRVFLLSYQSIENNKIFMKDFNYHKDKWFSLTETNEELQIKKSNAANAKLILNPDGNFSGRIKEIFIFDRIFFNSSENKNENWILLYLKQKYKLNDVKFVLDKK